MDFAVFSQTHTKLIPNSYRTPTELLPNSWWARTRTTSDPTDMSWSHHLSRHMCVYDCINMCMHHIMYSFYTIAVDHSATRTYMDKIPKHFAKFICSPPFPLKFNVGGQQGDPLRTDKISKHHDVNFHCAFNIELGGAGCKACKMLFQSVWILCPSTV